MTDDELEAGWHATHRFAFFEVVEVLDGAVAPAGTLAAVLGMSPVEDSDDPRRDYAVAILDEDKNMRGTVMIEESALRSTGEQMQRSDFYGD